MTITIPFHNLTIPRWDWSRIAAHRCPSNVRLGFSASYCPFGLSAFSIVGGPFGPFLKLLGTIATLPHPPSPRRGLGP